MPRVLNPFRFLLIAVAGWMNQHQLLAIDYLREENRILREQLGGRRLRFTDGQRRRLAAKAKGLGRKLLAEFATIVTPETLLAWHRQLIAHKYDGSGKRGPGRPRTIGEIEALVTLMAEENRDGGYRASRAPCPIWGTKWPAARSLRFWSGMDSTLHRNETEKRLELGRNSCHDIGARWSRPISPPWLGWTRRGLQRFLVLFFIDLSTRKVEIAGMAQAANGLWMSQIARNLTDAEPGILTGVCHECEWKLAELYRRWEKASRSRLSGVGFKPPGAAAFKRRGGERPRKRRPRRASGER